MGNSAEVQHKNYFSDREKIMKTLLLENLGIDYPNATPPGRVVMTCQIVIKDGLSQTED